MSPRNEQSSPGATPRALFVVPALCATITARFWSRDQHAALVHEPRPPFVGFPERQGACRPAPAVQKLPLSIDLRLPRPTRRDRGARNRAGGRSSESTRGARLDATDAARSCGRVRRMVRRPFGRSPRTRPSVLLLSRRRNRAARRIHASAEGRLRTDSARCAFAVPFLPFLDAAG
jgi:hypothetical protein